MLSDMKNKRTLAIDYGTKRIGLAVSDELGILASPAGILERKKDDVSDIVAFALEKNCSAVILGLPTTLKGTQSDWTEEVKKFGDKLSKQLHKNNITFEYYDERFTSIIAETNIREVHKKRIKLTDKSLRDTESARILLQEWLDKQRQ
jgi:putative Holliday junction resolvase